jgi:hypothetical protein
VKKSYYAQQYYTGRFDNELATNAYTDVHVVASLGVTVNVRLSVFREKTLSPASRVLRKMSEKKKMSETILSQTI